MIIWCKARQGEEFSGREMLRPQEVQKNLQIYLQRFLVQSKTVRLPVVNTAEP